MNFPRNPTGLHHSAIRRVQDIALLLETAAEPALDEQGRNRVVKFTA
jgi:hypothetical protein